MDPNTEISRVAIVGTGLIGSSWAACFLAHGLDVVATDPAPGAEDKVRQYVEAAWAALTKIGLAPGASTSRLRFTTDLKEAIVGADLVLENAPEREPVKIKLFAELDSILPPPAILAASTSGISMSRIQSECKHPERCVTAHPFNPPHLMPLVEVVGGAKTSDRSGCDQRGGRRCCSVYGSGSALVSNGTEPSLPSRRWTRRYASFL
jgi:3-hydroxyacyl-CoA dehydrogenase